MCHHLDGHDRIKLGVKSVRHNVKIFVGDRIIKLMWTQFFIVGGWVVLVLVWLLSV